MKRRLLSLLFVTASAISLGIVGCAQQRDSVTAQVPSQTTPTESPAVTPTTPATTPATTPTATPTTAPAQAPAQPQERALDVPYVPTPTAVVEEMLKLAKVGKNDVLYDLGSGDGRIVVTAAQKFGTKGVGVDIDPERVKEANENARKAGVTDRVEFRQQDLFKTDLRNATVVTLYLLPRINLQLRPKLFKELKPGTRIVSHAFDMGDWKPEKVVEVGSSTVYYWVVPEKIPENLRQ
ncbi:SAM-dependent methyltransferase [Phormidesmis sp. 146-33]